eukprot:scaffold848_cov247-Pinguiococcus_pyrenoidosus.AAC.4
MPLIAPSIATLPTRETEKYVGSHWYLESSYGRPHMSSAGLCACSPGRSFSHFGESSGLAKSKEPKNGDSPLT